MGSYSMLNFNKSWFMIWQIEVYSVLFDSCWLSQSYSSVHSIFYMEGVLSTQKYACWLSRLRGQQMFCLIISYFEFRYSLLWGTLCGWYFLYLNYICFANANKRDTSNSLHMQWMQKIINSIFDISRKGRGKFCSLREKMPASVDNIDGLMVLLTLLQFIIFL